MLISPDLKIIGYFEFLKLVRSLLFQSTASQTVLCVLIYFSSLLIIVKHSLSSVDIYYTCNYFRLLQINEIFPLIAIHKHA